MRYEFNLQQPDFTVGNIDILNVSRDKNYKYSYRNGRIKCGFVYVVSGQLRYDFLDDAIQTLKLQAGELIFIPNGCAYFATYLEEGTETKTVQFDITVGGLPAYLSAPRKIELVNAGELMDGFFKPLTNHSFYHFSCLYSLLWQIDDRYNKLPGKYRRLQPALTKIIRHSESNEKISGYAQRCNMSEVNFRRLFREYTGRSPIEYRNDVRLENARIRLQSGEYNVSEAAELSGFSNLSFFIRLYKKKYGHTPKKE